MPSELRPVCWRALTYADVCRRRMCGQLARMGERTWTSMLTYADVCWRMLTYVAGECTGNRRELARRIRTWPRNRARAHWKRYRKLLNNASVQQGSGQKKRSDLSIRKHTSAYVSIRQQHTGPSSLAMRERHYSNKILIKKCNMRQPCASDTTATKYWLRNATCVSICQHMSAYVSIRQHTSCASDTRPT
jgi:hypothetical protein